MSSRFLQIVNAPFLKPELCEESLKCVLDRVHKIEKNYGFDKNTLPIRIISIVGKVRIGKSFLIAAFKELLKDWDFFENPKNVIVGEDPDVLLKSGHPRHTPGINLFEEPLLIEDVDGPKMIVLLVDTQCAFDNRHNVDVSKMIISISNQIASTQIVNIKDYITVEDLDSLQLFVRFSTLQDEKMGQKLVFLIRDFVTDPEKYGRNREYLSEVINATNNSKELSSAVEDIFKAYEVVDCWTLPQPSPKLIRASNQVTVADLGDDFKMHLQKFLKSEIINHVPKKIYGTPLTADGVENLIKNVVQFAYDGSIQEMRSAVQRLIDQSYLDAEKKGIDTLFKLQRDSAISLPFDSIGFEEFRCNAHLKTLKAYDSVICFGSKKDKLEKRNRLVDRLVKNLEMIKEENEDRYFDSHCLGFLEKLKSDYRQTMKIPGVLRGTTDFEDLHQRTLRSLMAEFNEGPAKLAELPRMDSTVEAKRTQLEINIKGIYRELKGDNNYLLAKEKCKKTIANVQDAFRAKMNEMLDERPDPEDALDTFEQAVIEAKRQFLEGMASGKHIPEMSSIVNDMLEGEFLPVFARDKAMTLDRIREYNRQREIETEVLRDLQTKVNYVADKVICSIM